MDTSGYGGRRLKKVTLVYTNDPRLPELKLTIAGKVEEVVTINPRRVVFQGTAGQPLTKSVIIKPRKKYRPRKTYTKSVGKAARKEAAI